MNEGVNENMDLGAEKRKEIVNNMKSMFERELDSLAFHTTSKEDGKYRMQNSIKELKGSIDALETLIKETL